MRLLALFGFFASLACIGYVRGREVTWSEQCAWVGGVFLVALLMTLMNWW